MSLTSKCFETLYELLRKSEYNDNRMKLKKTAPLIYATCTTIFVNIKEAKTSFGLLNKAK